MPTVKKEYDEILEKLESDTNLKEGYMYSEMMMLKKDLLTEYKGAEAGKQFALQHLQIEKFRRQAIRGCHARLGLPTCLPTLRRRHHTR